jgi:hypothetical protein
MAKTEAGLSNLAYQQRFRVFKATATRDLNDLVNAEAALDLLGATTCATHPVTGSSALTPANEPPASNPPSAPVTGLAGSGVSS